MKWACLTQSAIEDIDIAKAWYDARDVGDAFIAQIENTLTLISFKPELYAQVFQDVRRANLERFPYGLFFTLEDGTPVVVACLHHKRGGLTVLLAERKDQKQSP